MCFNSSAASCIQILKLVFLFTIANRSYRKLTYIYSILVLGVQVILFQFESLGDRGNWMSQINETQTARNFIVVPVILCVDLEPNLKSFMWLSLRQKSAQVTMNFICSRPREVFQFGMLWFQSFS